MSDDTEYHGHGLIDTLEIQRRFNELDLLIQKQVRESASDDPFERIRQIAAAQAELREQVDQLIATRSKSEAGE